MNKCKSLFYFIKSDFYDKIFIEVFKLRVNKEEKSENIEKELNQEIVSDNNPQSSHLKNKKDIKKILKLCLFGLIGLGVILMIVLLIIYGGK